MEKLKKLKEQSKLSYGILIGSSIAFLILMPTVFLLLVGMGIDAYTHKSPLFTLSGAIVGFLSSFYNIYRLLKRLTQ